MWVQKSEESSRPFRVYWSIAKDFMHAAVEKKIFKGQQQQPNWYSRMRELRQLTYLLQLTLLPKYFVLISLISKSVILKKLDRNNVEFFLK